MCYVNPHLTFTKSSQSKWQQNKTVTHNLEQSQNTYKNESKIATNNTCRSVVPNDKIGLYTNLQKCTAGHRLLV